MKAFLSYRFGDNISGVRKLLSDYNIEAFSDVQIGDSLQGAIKGAVKNCDFVLFIYSEDNPNIAFEAGLAVAFNKPIFSILSGGNENTFLLDTPYVHAKPDEVEKIKFSFELFLKNLESKKSVRRTFVKSNVFYGGSEAVPDKKYFDIEKRYNSIVDKSGIELERFIEDVLNAYAIDTAKRPASDREGKQRYPDFSIWSDELAQVLGNPIVIEVKKEINPTNLKNLIAQLNTLISSNPANAAIIFYDELRQIEEKDLPATPYLLFIAIPELVKTLEKGGFATAIKTIRNYKVHNF
ncbi:MAG: toll/interleukin-1 receptor domain-containing protein [Bacteroidetes bacterium]|nr:toll/interleukin-1 receptor domain-containing protein [Bacteroidota bacterium]